MQAGRNRHEHIMESIELFGTEVLPEFAERDEAAVAAKARQWAPVVEAAMARRVGGSPPMPADYVMKAIPKQMVDAMADEAAQRWMEDLADKQAAGVARRGVPAADRRPRRLLNKAGLRRRLALQAQDMSDRSADTKRVEVGHPGGHCPKSGPFLTA